tara:strand:- start:96 stop:677 length:582 start_codon:yes stop_codon:yes gene_type:complete
MAISIKINKPEEQQQTQEQIKIVIPDDSKKELLEFDLNMRRALNGDLMIFDHKDIDIVIMVENKKIVAFAKDLMSEIVYGAENRLFKHLKKAGIVQFDSIKGGNVYGSLEANILNSIELDPIKASIYEISRWMDEEKPYMSSVEAHDEMMDDELLEPEGDNVTDLGDVPHEEEKGSILQRNLFAPYLYGRYTY